MIIAALAGIKFLQPEVLVVCIAERNIPSIFCRFTGTGKYQCHCCLCGGKSILDLGLTTEYLETFGVPLMVIRQKRCLRFSAEPAHLMSDSSRQCPRNCSRDGSEVANRLNGGLVVANPIPEQFAMPEEPSMQQLIKPLLKPKNRVLLEREYTVPAGACCGANRR